MSRVLVDTNTVIDLLSKREGFSDETPECVVSKSIVGISVNPNAKSPSGATS